MCPFLHNYYSVSNVIQSPSSYNTIIIIPQPIFIFPTILPSR